MEISSLVMALRSCFPDYREAAVQEVPKTEPVDLQVERWDRLVFVSMDLD
jgi:hypothetical protein